MNASRIEITREDITKLNVTAIVNAANKKLLGGGGVDGAIHRAAGPELLEECRQVGPCPTGEVRVTGGYKLPAKYVIHTVGPVWNGGQNREAELLAACYSNSLRTAVEYEIDSVAFPCISTGIYGFPKAQACEIAVTTAAEWLRDHQLPRRIVFCCFEAEDQELYQQQLKSSSP